MPKFSLIYLLCFYLLVYQSNVFAVNAISIREDFTHGVMPGFIKSATLVIEPHGASAEQSLYVAYTDKNQFEGNNVEIIHRFELPSGSTVHDLWLWIGDSVMQAKIMNTVTARHVYDSITSFKRDPAFLNVVNDQYELRIYPLQSGQMRKIKMSMQSQMAFIGKLANVSTPLNFLRSDNNSTTQLRVLFRFDKRLTYKPQFMETNELKFTDLPDTLNWHYKECFIDDIKKFKFLTLTYEETCTTGISVKLGKIKKGFIANIGVNPMDIFSSERISKEPRNILIGQDLSGVYGFDSKLFKTGFENFLKSYLRNGDSIRIFIAGEGHYDTLPENGVYISSLSNTDSISNAVYSSPVISLKQNRRKAKILFVDSYAQGIWSFPGLDSLAQCSTSISGLISCLPKLQEFDLVAAYAHGLEVILSDEEAQLARKEIMQFMKSGGIFLTYFDYNRGEEKIASHFIDSIQKPGQFVPSNINRNSQGTIGSLLSISFYYYTSCPLIHSDDSVVNEATNSNGDPVLISKPYGAGRFVVSGMWTYHDDAALKQQLSTALFGLQTLNVQRQLPDLLHTMINATSSSRYDELVLISNSDDLVTAENINKKLGSVDTSKLKDIPPTHCISLLDGQSYSPPIYMSGLTKYLGSDFLLANIAKITGGDFFSTFDYDMGTIGRIVANNFQGMPKEIAVKVHCADNEISDDSIYAINNSSTNSGLQYFLAKCDSTDTISITVSGNDPLKDSIVSKKVTLSTESLFTEKNDAIYTMYSIQIMKKMLQAAQLDTQSIINFSIKNRLLNDFTAFLAIEPNDSNFFMRDPFDESKYKVSARKVLKSVQTALSLVVKSAGNVLQYSLSGIGKLEMRLFDLNGKCVYSKSFTCSGFLSKQLKIKSLGLANGTYIAVAKFVSSDKRNGNKPVTKIVRFIVR